MDSKSFKTSYLNKESIVKNWFVANADGKTLGRFSSEVAKSLRGKHKASYTPHMDCGDYLIVINVFSYFPHYRLYSFTNCS